MTLTRRLGTVVGTAALALGVFAGPAWAEENNDDGANCDNENNSSVEGDDVVIGVSTGGNLNCNEIEIA